jgi:hypothetical protein
VVQLRSSLFRLAAPALYRLDGGKPAAPQPVSFYAAVFFFVNVTYILLIWELIEPRADVPVRVRRSMRYRSIATLCLFGTASMVALKYPLRWSWNLLLLPGRLSETRCAGGGAKLVSYRLSVIV